MQMKIFKSTFSKFNFKNVVLSSLVFLVACSSKLKIQSEPSDIEVFVSQQNSAQKKSLGKTTIEITYSDLSEKIRGTQNSGEFVYMSFESKDFDIEKVLLPSRPFGLTSTQIFVKLTPLKDVSQARDILQKLHNAQKFAQAGQFDRALVDIDKVLEVDPNFIRALSLKGSVYYLQKNYDEALKWFEKALALDGSFEEAVKMIAKIKEEKKK
jgi:tetratricopeptide (TPR) repeat protein